MNELDLRGLPCPQPVVETKRALEGISAGKLRVLVNDESSLLNVRRLAESLGCQVVVTQRGDDFAITITKPAPMRRMDSAAANEVVVFINSALVGRGDDELGVVLMRSFTYALAESSSKPGKVVFMNSGVKLGTEGSPVLDNLTKLAGLGVDLMFCGTCLDFYGLKDRLQAGRVSNMYEIVQTFLQANKVITL